MANTGQQKFKDTQISQTLKMIKNDFFFLNCTKFKVSKCFFHTHTWFVFHLVCNDDAIMRKVKVNNILLALHRTVQQVWPFHTYFELCHMFSM